MSRARGAPRVPYTAGMVTVLALSYAIKADIGLIAIFGVIFPALVTGLILFAAAQAAAERRENVERRHGRRD